MLEFSEQCKEHHFVDESFRAEAIWALPTALLNLRYRIDCSDTFSWSNFQNFQLVCRCVFFSQGPMFFWLFHWVSLWIFPAFIHFSQSLKWSQEPFYMKTGLSLRQLNHKDSDMRIIFLLNSNNFNDREHHGWSTSTRSSSKVLVLEVLLRNTPRENIHRHLSLTAPIW